MKLGVISDIHGNKPALEAVLEDLYATHSVDEIICVGDIVGVLGWPDETVTLVREHASHAVYGNHDSRFFPSRTFRPQKEYEVVEYESVTNSLSDSNMNWLQSLPGMVSAHDDLVILAHARPNPDDPDGSATGDLGINPRDYISVGSTTPEGSIAFIGHTHYQHAVNLDKFTGQSGLLLNPGSVGFPYKHEQVQTNEGLMTYGKAEYAVVDTETQDYELCSVIYDATEVLKHLRHHGID